MACTYIYNNKRYSEYQILSLIRNGTVKTSNNVEGARIYLRDKLGMTDDQIEIVKGLIDGKAFGKLLSDGKILLSDEMTEGTERHEAFHRVFRLFLDNQQRSNILNEFKSRANWSQSLNSLRELYPELSEDRLIEEALADEFMMYSLSNGQYEIPGTESKSFFAKLWNWLKSLLGFGIKDLYDRIEAGKYKSAPQVVYETDEAYSRVVLPNSVLTTEHKIELFESLTFHFLDTAFNKHNIYDIINGKFNVDLNNVFSRLLVNTDRTGVLNKVSLKNPQLAIDLAKEIFVKVGDNLTFNTNSVFLKDFFKHLSTVGIKAGVDMVDETSMEFKEMSEEEQDVMKDFSFMKVAFEFDPKASMSKSIKLLLSSLPDKKSTSIFGLDRAVPYNNVATLLFNNLANLPASFEVFVEELEKLAVKHPYLTKLIERLGPTVTSYSSLKFKNEFVRTFGKNKYSFLLGMMRKGNIFSLDAMFNDLQARTIQEFKNNLIVYNKDANDLISNLQSKEITDITAALGLSDLDNLLQLPTSNNKTVGQRVLELRGIIIDSIKAGTPIQKLYDKNTNYKLNVKNLIKDLAGILNEFKKPLDLMFYNAEGKKVYAISLNNYQTIVTNTLNWIGAKNITLEEKIELVKKHIPHVLNNETYKDGVFKSAWLSSILQGNKLVISVFDGIKGQKEKAFKDLNETDLFTFYLNMQVEGVHMGIKHSDRSTIFSYHLANKSKPILDGDYDSMLNIAVDRALSYYNDELENIQEKTPSTVKNFSKNKSKSQHFGFVKGDPASDIKSHFSKAISDLVDSAAGQGLFNLYNGKPVGISKETWLNFSQNGAVKNDAAVKAFVANAYLNNFFNRIEEQKLLLGHLGIYKNLDDAYKRFAMQSGTGDILVADKYNDAYINYMNRKDTVDIYNPITGSVNTIAYNKPMGYFSELVLEESEQYESSLLQSYGDGTVLKHVFKINLKEAYIRQLGIDDAAADKMADIAAEKYADKYKGINENDGMSYANIFSWREFEHRNGIWTPEKENTFQLELAASTLQNRSELANLTVYVDNNGKVSAKTSENSIAIKPFNMRDIAQKLNIADPVEWYNKTFESGNMLKPQYTGPVHHDIEDNDGNFIIGGRKTAYGILFPTMILGTNLQKLNATMINKGVDFVHMSSAAKYGYYDPKLILPEHADISKRGLQMYTESGEFNDAIFEQADLLKTYLDVRYMKNQLSISNKPKSAIKNSTQSAKIIIANIMQNGVPRDIDIRNAALFKNFTEEKKREVSPLYKLMRDYSDTLNSLINNNLNSLLTELDVAKSLNSDGLAIGKFEKLIKILRESAESKNSAASVLEAIELFSDDKTIELLSNKSKIENILFSIISNRVIRFERPGDAKPQFAVTGLESGTRSFSSSALKFYEPVLNEVGEVIKVNPAEIMLPLPKKRIKEFLSRFKTDNIITAIERYNALPDDDKFIVKGLRIPNQQMSSNDVFRIKQFFMPTLESFVVVPTEIVAKAGADFDIDKLQIYYPDGKKDSGYNKLLKLEIDLLLHPSNIHQLLAPVIDDKLKQDILAEVVGVLEKGLSAEEAMRQAISEELVSKSTLSDYTDITKNIDKFKLYIETKTGVGQIATVITTHSVAQSDNIELNAVTLLPDKDGVYAIPVSTGIPFEGFENQNSLSTIMDTQGQFITETLSMLLTSQVDGAKNPYPSRLNITNQTLNVITYLARRGVPLSTIIKFVKQPLITEYLNRQRINESELYQNTKGQSSLKLNKKSLLESVVGTDNINEVMQNIQNGGAKMSEQDLDNGIKNPTKESQVKFLLHFLNLIDITRNFRLFMSDMTPDTKTMKDMAAIENIIENFDNLQQSQIINNIEQYRNGVLKPFFEARNYYRDLYLDLYFTKKSVHAADLKKMYEVFSQIQRKEDDKVKAINTVENDFITYLLQNLHPAFKKYSFDSLFKGENSLPKRIDAILKDPTNPQSDNYALKNLYLFFKQDGDIDNMRIYDRNLPTLAIDDMYDAVRELPLDMQEQLIVYNSYQAGNSVSPFQLEAILPVDLKFNMIKSVIEKDPYIKFEDFMDKFMLNNPTLLPTNKWQAKHNKFGIYASYEDEKLVIKTVKDDFEIPQLGNAFTKIYNNTGTVQQPVAKPVVKTKATPPVNTATETIDTVEFYNANIAKFKEAGITGMDFMMASNDAQLKMIQQVQKNESIQKAAPEDDAPSVMDVYESIDEIAFYDMYSAKFKAQRISVTDWVDATDANKRALIQKCIG